MLANLGAFQFELERVDVGSWDARGGQRFMRLEGGDEVSRVERGSETYLVVDYRRSSGLARVERWRCLTEGEGNITGLIVLCDVRRAG